MKHIPYLPVPLPLPPGRAKRPRDLGGTRGRGLDALAQKNTSELLHLKKKKKGHFGVSRV